MNPDNEYFNVSRFNLSNFESNVWTDEKEANNKLFTDN
jgi:hypothetical protein